MKDKISTHRDFNLEKNEKIINANKVKHMNELCDSDISQFQNLVSERKILSRGGAR